MMHAFRTLPAAPTASSKFWRLALLVSLMAFSAWCASERIGWAEAAAAGTQTNGSNGRHAPEFVGSATCAACHAQEHADWQTSQHHAAMQVATEQTVLGNFENASFTKDGVETTFFKKDGKFWVRTDGPDGKLEDFEIRYTFGIAPLQQYLVALPGGRYQALGIAWDARPKEDGGQRWYHLYPDQALKSGDPLHWTGIDQNWNYQCAWCHATNLQKNYDAKSRTFQTTWSELGAGCESCHGPASDHVAWATLGEPAREDKGLLVRFDERRGVTWQMGGNGQASRSVPRTTAKEIEVCATCHARRQQFSSDPASLASLTDAFRPATLDAGLYHADGQQRDEVFNYSSFIQSKMHAAGVTCSDCHNPHSGKLRQTGNAVCGQCHAPEKFDSGAHHHHGEGTAGSRCTACHMPATTYMGVDARHDHSMRVPRPDRSILLGTPNACTMCHAGKTATWARDAIKGWYPNPKPGAQDFAEAFDLADRGAPGGSAALLKVASSPMSSAIARASALARLGRAPSADALDLAIQSLKIEDPMVRNAAISIIAVADAATRAKALAPLLRDPSRLVRMDAARALAGQPETMLSGDGRAAFEAALSEYVDAQKYNAERPEEQTNLAGLYRDQGRVEEARAAYRTAIGLDPTFVAASISLADLERLQGNERGAEEVLRAAVTANPSSGPAQHALGLSLIRQKRAADAMSPLAEAARIAPEDPRFSYVFAVALHDTGRAGEARDVLKNTLARHPYDREVLTALISYEMEVAQFSTALEYAERLLELEPGNSEVAAFVERLRRQTRR